VQQSMPALLPVMRAEVIRREVGTAEYETTVAATRARHVSRGRRKGHRCAYSLTAQQPPARR